MPVMTRFARHGETTISTIDSDASLKDRGDSCTRRGSASSRRAATHARGEHTKSNSSGAGIASPQLMPSTGGHLNEKSALPVSEREARPLSSGSSSTMSRFVERLEASVYSLSSLRTIPSWRSTLSRAHNTYAIIECGNDGGGGSDLDTTTPSLPREFGGAPPSSQRSSFGNNSLWNNSLRPRRHDKRARGPNNVFHTSLSDILARFSHAVSNSTSGHHGPGTSSSSSLGTAHPSSSPGGSHIPFPSTSEESSSASASASASASSSSSSYPSPYSADAVAAFQAPRNKGDAPPYFDGGRVKYRGIFEDHIRVDFAEAADGTCTSASASTGTSATSMRATSKSRRLLAPLRRRVSAVARSVTPTRRKFPTIFHKARRSPRPVDDDDDPVEYDIPCLAYITCLW